MSRSQPARSLAAVAATFLAAAVAPLIGAGSAHASDGGGCQSATVQYRLVDADGKTVGADWTSQGGFHQWDTVPGTVEVRLAPGQSVGEGCKYPVSLAEYTTEGPNWASSGAQQMVDKATVYLTDKDVAGQDDAGRTWQKLGVKAPTCFGQIDLYGDDTAYDGKEGEGHGRLPDVRTGVLTPYHLIAAWNGGDKRCESATPESPSSPSAPAPSASAPESPANPEPSAPSGKETTPAPQPKPSGTPSTSADIPPLSSSPSAEAKVSPNGGAKPPLAETGAGSVGMLAGGAALVLALGAGTVYVSRTRRS
ncbi:hypothetical protein GTW40_31390 [Streptomyces sp. SID4985]|uniref:hypothetical protein n=1 Tax=Streptomyces sp. SID4985 TaxID=2690292 RepID=UPI00136B327C|nr:hypothetical protein [Streptomyces sp. SID4985]MYQ49473.1 hypothetical protein [Streptomyces sp. SID4985]